MNFRILCWNVRNLSEEIARQGVRGHGLDIFFRIKAVMEIIQKQKADLNILLETGPDAQALCDSLNANYTDYLAFSSEVTGGESYIAIQRKKALLSIKEKKLVGVVPVKFRQGWLLTLDLGVLINVLVLHAPSPSHDLSNVRLATISNVVNSAVGKIPVIFCGDLNIKSNEFKSLAATLNAIPRATFCGPYLIENNTTVLVNTSLKKFTTILNSPDIDSQPYDQFWYFDSSVSPISWNYTCLKVSLGASNMAVETFVEYITTQLQTYSSIDTSSLSGPSTKLSEQDVTVDDKDEILSGLQKFNVSLNELLKVSPESQKLILQGSFRIPLADWKKYASAVSIQLAGIKPGIVLKQRKYAAIVNLLNQFNEYLDMAVTCLDIKTNGGSEGVSWIEKIAYEYCISDHSPILLELSR